jgi:methionine aminotransferase
MPGWMPLRETLATKIEFLYKAKPNPSSKSPLHRTYAIYTALTTILQPGDEVIVFEPAYDSYIPNIEVNGAIPALVKLEYPGYKINWEMVKSKINKKTRAILLNSPNNPTGSILGEEDIAALRSILKGTNIFIVSDEVYEHLVFDGLPHLSMLRYPDLYERSFTCFFW